jgi:mRNA interferase MazF
MEQLQWSIVYVYLDPSVGREQAGNRPALIVSDEAFNRNMEVVTILPVTSHKPGRTVYPNEVLLAAEESGLEVESIVMAHQIRTISRHRIKRRVARLTAPALQEACLEAIRIHLGMY